jgi:hypothetical protein
MKLRTFLGTVAALAMTGVVGLGLASPALAAYGSETGSATVSATTVNRGGSVTVSGSRFCPGGRVTATVSQHSRVYITKTARANSQGRVSFRLKLTKSGVNTIKLTGRQSDCTGTRVLGVKVSVRGGATGGNGNVAGNKSGLPGTGGVDFTPLYAGLGLLAAGAMLVGVAHSRRRILL